MHEKSKYNNLKEKTNVNDVEDPLLRLKKRLANSKARFSIHGCIVGSRGASQLGGSLLGIPPGYKANKLIIMYKS